MDVKNDEESSSSSDDEGEMLSIRSSYDPMEKAGFPVSSGKSRVNSALFKEISGEIKCYYTFEDGLNLDNIPPNFRPGSLSDSSVHLLLVFSKCMFATMIECDVPFFELSGVGFLFSKTKTAIKYGTVIYLNPILAETFIGGETKEERFCKEFAYCLEMAKEQTNKYFIRPSLNLSVWAKFFRNQILSRGEKQLAFKLRQCEKEWKNRNNNDNQNKRQKLK